ncbi:hypothetical protein PR048_017865, partial [Dryococelus australis]
MSRGGLRRQPVSSEHSYVVDKRIGNSSRREEVCDASKPRHCRHTRESRGGGGIATSASFQEEGAEHLSRLQLQHAAVAERLACSPPTKANIGSILGRVTLDFRMWESYSTMPLMCRFSRESQVFPTLAITALLHTHPNHPHRRQSARRRQEPCSDRAPSSGGIVSDIANNRRFGRAEGDTATHFECLVSSPLRPSINSAFRLGRRRRVYFLRSSGLLPDFCKWESCRTMTLVGGLSRGSPVFPAFAFRCRFIITTFRNLSALKTSVLRATQIYIYISNSLNHFSHRYFVRNCTCVIEALLHTSRPMENVSCAQCCCQRLFVVVRHSL